jgi:AcrR family transcriptional regulator
MSAVPDATPARRRKRAAELHEAVDQAVLAELQEWGYAAFSMDRVASRAHTSRSTLYRHWPNKLKLVVHVLRRSIPDIVIPVDRGDLRGELLSVLRQVADNMDSPSGAAARGIFAEIVRTPELVKIARPFLADPLVAPMLEVLRRAVVRCDISVAVLTPRIAGVGTDLVRQYAIINGTPIPQQVLVEIVDDVVLPLIRGVQI